MNAKTRLLQQENLIRALGVVTWLAHAGRSLGGGGKGKGASKPGTILHAVKLMGELLPEEEEPSYTAPRPKTHERTRFLNP